MWQVNEPINGPNEGIPAANAPVVAPGFGGGPSALGLGRGFVQKAKVSGDSWRSSFMFGRGSEVSTTRRNTQVDRNLRAPRWKGLRLPPIQKDVYLEHITTARRPMEEVEAYWQTNGITVTGCDIPKPILRINEHSFPKPISKVIEALNPGSALRAMQAQCWPVAMKGKDLVVIDLNGSKDKHQAYLVPAIIHVLHQPVVLRGSEPFVLVVTVTRIAALLVQKAADELKAGSGIRISYLLPGEPREPQLKDLGEGAHICVATPGRLVSFMEECKINLRGCTYLVLDEFDRMISMGFEKQLRVIVDNIRPDRQILLWLSSRCIVAKQMIEEWMSDYVTVTFGTASREDQVCKVEHVVYVCETAEKEQKLAALFNDILREESDKAIVFVEQKQTVEDIMSYLRLQGWLAIGIHGTMTAQKREYALNTLKLEKVPIMVTTNVAACAQAVDKVRFVVNYDCPRSSSEYSRRSKYASGLVGAGVMCSFIAPHETRLSKELISFLRETKQVIPPELRKVANGIRVR
ncbi:putative ATP-dependent RNA helicase DDX5 [Rhipicephalus microplus]|uniref:putative ATP-dependent RNA helicase DDX5 n=1 Tax=Rhipicephalus microplus TaxID=6941 RepID=UPI003F6AA53B